MNTPVLSAQEVAAFLEEGYLVLRRPLTWSVVWRLLEALAEAEAEEGEE